MAKRPSLKSAVSPIAARAVAKPNAAAPRAAEEGVDASTRAGKSARDEEYYRTRDFKGVLARINRDGWLELKKLSAEIDVSFQDIMVESLNDFLQKHNRSPVVESRVLPKD